MVVQLCSCSDSAIGGAKVPHWRWSKIENGPRLWPSESAYDVKAVAVEARSQHQIRRAWSESRRITSKLQLPVLFTLELDARSHIELSSSTAASSTLLLKR